MKKHSQVEQKAGEVFMTKAPYWKSRLNPGSAKGMCPWASFLISPGPNKSTFSLHLSTWSYLDCKLFRPEDSHQEQTGSSLCGVTLCYCNQSNNSDHPGGPNLAVPI